MPPNHIHDHGNLDVNTSLRIASNRNSALGTIAYYDSGPNQSVKKATEMREAIEVYIAIAKATGIVPDSEDDLDWIDEDAILRDYGIVVANDETRRSTEEVDA